MNFKEGNKTGKLVFWEDHSDSSGEHTLKSCHFWRHRDYLDAVIREVRDSQLSTECWNS